MATQIIETRDLVRDYKKLRAVDHISFTVEPGEAVGYIGANGAGKSTTIKMLTGILRPTSGLVRTCGRDPLRERIALARIDKERERDTGQASPAADAGRTTRGDGTSSV